MSSNSALKTKHPNSKQVWTPLKKPPHPGTVHILSDDALLVLAALREAHRKKLKEQQQQSRCQKTKDARSYYTQIYAQSFKTERADTGTEQTPSHTQTNILPGAQNNQVYASQPHPSSFDSGPRSTWMNPTQPVFSVTVVKTEPEIETQFSNMTQNSKLPYQVNEVPQQKTTVGNAFPSEPELSRNVTFGYNSNSPSTSRFVHTTLLPRVNMSQGSISTSRNHPDEVTRSLSPENVQKVNDHATLPTFETTPSQQSMIDVSDESSEIFSTSGPLQIPQFPSIKDVEELDDHTSMSSLVETQSSLQKATYRKSFSRGSETLPRPCPVPVPQCLSSAEDVEELDDHATSSASKTVPSLQNISGASSKPNIQISRNLPRTCPVPVSRCLPSAEDVEELDDHATSSASKTLPSLQKITGTSSKPIIQISRNLSRTCPVPVSRCLPSAEDVEDLDDHAALPDIPVRFSTPKVDISNTGHKCPTKPIVMNPVQIDKVLSKNRKRVSAESSAVDMELLSLKAISKGNNQDCRASKLNKRGNVCISSKTSSDTSIAVKKRVVPTFIAKISGSKEKSRSKTETLTQMSIEKVMGVDRRRVAATSAKSITSMSPPDLTKLQEIISEAEEILMMLMYTDGSTQLRELDEMTKAGKRSSVSVHEDGIASSLLVAIKHKAAKKEHTFISFPLARPGKENASEETRNVLLEILQSNIRKVCFDAQEMMHAIITNCRLDPQSGCSTWLIMDPKIACWLLDPDNPPVTFSEMLKTFLAGKYNLTPDDQLDLTLLGTAMEALTNTLQRKGLWDLFISLEVPLIPILAGMEVQGIQVNQKMLLFYSNILKDEIKKIETQCYKEAGHPFQITSHIQLRQVLFNELKLDEKCPGQKLARTNVQNLKSTSETVLHKLKVLHPLPELVLNYRQLVKLKSTYIDGLAEYVCGGYIHTSWEQTSASSGRLQSANPNIQNIPKQPLHLHENTKRGIAEDTDASSPTTLWMREPFFAHDGWSFIAADFQSIELRILAHLSQDAVLLKVFNDAGSTDIFVQLTCEWLGMKPADVKPTDRERTKRIVYSVVYGVGAERLAETLNDTKENAKAFTKSFLGKFKGVNTFAHRCISECQRHGYVKTIFQRHRLISNITSQNFHVRSHAERQAVNFVIQGSAADICKLAMIRIMMVLSEKDSLRARLLVQIHDELLFEVHDDDINEVKGLLKKVMESTPILGESICELKVPLPVSLSSGKTWGHLQQV